jgi:hypothetical protein
MPRSRDEEAWRARRYGRRRRLLRAMPSDAELASVVDDLLRDLRASAVLKVAQVRLVEDLERHRDVARRRAATWAIVDAVEEADPRPSS